MVDPSLLEITTRRLTADAPEGATWPILVLAAFGGEDALTAALEHNVAPALELSQRDGSASRTFLSSITVEGFRGIGARRTLSVKPGPGLTLVVGRNGSGKSSFAEALELLLTGSNWRWAERSKVWRDGWRNLHHDRVEIEAAFAVDGLRGDLMLTQRWDAGADLQGGEAWSQATGSPRGPIDEPGWLPAAESYRPILSYNELGSMFDEGPTAFHDRLARILGLGQIDLATKVLRDARLNVQRILKEIDTGAAALIVRLEPLEDPRAQAAIVELRRRKRNLTALSQLVGAPDVGSDSDIGLLRELSRLVAPDPAEGVRLEQVASDLVERHRDLRSSAALRTKRLVDLLRLGLEHFSEHGDGDCPLCGSAGAIDESWSVRARIQMAEAETASAAVADLHAARAKLLKDVQALVGQPPAALAKASTVGLEGAAVVALWNEAAAPVESAGEVPKRLASIPELATRVASIREAATRELERREAAWRPVAHSLIGWLHDAEPRSALESRERDLQSAERWLKGVSAELRRERFGPIAQRAIELWQVFRQQSSVELKRVMLEGAGTMRRVALDVAIDGVDGAALGVMSQGELHAMALSLFLPRATLEESPFRFVVIDDPVQSMDPARVDGLARVLEETATTRQVVVFTHDDRLPEATRRLGIDASILQITRRSNSAVDVRQVLTPVDRYLSDARAVAKADDVPAAVGPQVVPGICRFAIEAACTDVVRLRRIRRGEAHADVEELLQANPKTTQRMALALFDDAARASDVAERIRSWGSRFADAWYGATKGVHKGYAGSLADLVRDVTALCDRIAQLP